MKFLLDFRKFKTLLLSGLILLTGIDINAQSEEAGIPHIESIELKEYGVANKLYGALQNSLGVMYLTNDNGVIEFDGSHWNLIELGSKPVICRDENGVIYAAAYNQFGILTGDHANKTIFTPTPDTPTRPENFGQIRHITSGRNEILFANQNTLYTYREGNFTKLLQSNQAIKIFKVKHDIYVQDLNQGLFAFSNGKLHPLPENELFARHEILDIVQYNKFILLKEKSVKGFTLYNYNDRVPFTTASDDYIQEHQFSSFAVLKDGELIVGTQSGGIVLLNKSGNIIDIFTHENGLYSNSIEKIFVDQDQNIWVLHENGISILQFPTAISHFNLSKGISSTIIDLIRFKKTLYAATKNGLYFLNTETNNFEQVLGIESHCYGLREVDNHLFAHSTHGVHEISGNESQMVLQGNYREIYQSNINPANAYFASTNKLEIFKYTNLSIELVKEYDNLPFNILQICEDESEDIWLRTTENELFLVPLEVILNHTGDLDFMQFQRANYKFSWLEMIETKSHGLIFSTDKGLFKYNKIQRTFIPDTNIQSQIEKEKFTIFPIAEDDEQNIWMNIISKKDYNNHLAFLPHGNNSNIRNLIFEQLQNFAPTYIHPEEKGIIWLGGFKNVVRIDTNLLHHSENDIHTVINTIFVNGDEELFNGLHQIQDGELKDTLFKIPFSKNKMRFQFSATYYKDLRGIEYSTKLTGFHNDWTEWSPENFVEYTNLPKGKYTFVVKSRNVLHKESEPVSFEFTIKAPIYKTWYAIIIYAVFVILIINIYIQFRAFQHAKEKYELETIINNRTEELLQQKEKSDNLLAKVLPKNTADELKKSGKATSQKFQMVTVLFSDIQGFTRISDQINPETLLDELDKFFYHFDNVVEKYNIEKIKTIGDAYMCAGGIPEKNSTNPVEVVLAGLEMQLYLKRLNEEKALGDSKVWELRIGIDTGPVIAGVVGQKKLTYDIWGGTVNVASRMESSGEIGQINISGNTYMLVKDYFVCRYRGKMPVKNKGSIDMYFVEGVQPEYSVNGMGLEPNHEFFINLQLLRLNDLEEVLFDKLENGLPKDLYFHNLNHTLSVYAICELIGREENLNNEQILLLRTAALFHDTGFLITYDNHEQTSVKLAKELLPEYKYTNEQITTIERLILSTRDYYQPKDILEKVLIDADHDHFGRDDYMTLIHNFYREQNEKGIIRDKKQWYTDQYELLKNHKFHTKTAEDFRRVTKEHQVKEFQKYLKNL